MFGSGIEGLVIKYTLGTMFFAVTVMFGVKIVVLLAGVAKLKLIGLLDGHELLKTGIEKLLERGSIK